MKKTRDELVELQELYCDKCDVEMEEYYVDLKNFPRIYTYKCPNCGELDFRKHMYPRVIIKNGEDGETSYPVF